MIQAIVFLPLLGAILAGLIAIFGAHARNPSGDTVEHHGGDGHQHASTTHVNQDAALVHVTHDEPLAHEDRAHDDHGVAEPAAAGSRPAESITTAFLFVAAALSWAMFIDIGFLHQEAGVTELLPWINSGDLQISWALRVDTLTAVMLVVVTTVSSLVH